MSIASDRETFATGVPKIETGEIDRVEIHESVELNGCGVID